MNIEVTGAGAKRSPPGESVRNGGFRFFTPKQAEAARQFIPRQRGA
jgi:hypothetical protein